MGLRLPPADDWLGFSVEYHGDPSQPGGHAEDSAGAYLVPTVQTCSLLAHSESLGEVTYGTGYFQSTTDDCVRAAVATLLQIPYEEVPALSGGGDQEEEVRDFGRSADYEPEPVIADPSAPPEIRAPDAGFWIGTVSGHRSEEAHAVVLYGLKVAFDPAWAMQRVNGWPQHRYAIQTGTKFSKTKDAK